LLGEERKTFELESKAALERVTKELEMATAKKTELLKEVEQIREERDEEARKETALTPRLNANAATKKEAVKGQGTCCRKRRGPNRTSTTTT
jgi:hypothetical protein